MKTRNGFVSNSSSSSFVVGFKKIPQNIEDVHELMFPEEIKVQLYEGYPEFSSSEIAKQVWNDIENQIPNDMSAIKEAGVPYGVLSDYHNPEFIKGKKKTGNGHEYDDYDWDKIQIAHDKEAEEYRTKFISKHPNLVWYVFNYGDEDGDFFSAMEHGRIFRNVAHYHISKH